MVLIKFIMLVVTYTLLELFSFFSACFGMNARKPEMIENIFFILIIVDKVDCDGFKP